MSEWDAVSTIIKAPEAQPIAQPATERKTSQWDSVSAPVRQQSITERNAKALQPAFDINDPKTPTESQLATDYKKGKSDIEILAASRFSPEQIDWMKSNPIGAIESIQKLSPADAVPFVAGGKQAYEAIDINSIAEKQSKGEKLSESEVQTMNTFVDSYIERELRGTTIGGDITSGVLQMPAFAVEFMATAGYGKLAQTAATKAAEKLLIKGAVAKAVGFAAQAAARTATMPARYIPAYAERRLNDGTAITDKGELIGKASTESPAKSALLAFGHTGVEVASEMSGAALGKYIVGPVVNAVKTPVIAAANKIPAILRDNLYNAYKAIQPNARVSQVFTQAGWNGMLEEMGEERVAQVMHETLNLASDKDYTTQDYLDNITPTSNQLLVEAGIISVAGGIKTSADITMNILKSKGVSEAEAAEAVANLSAIEMDNFVAANLIMPQSPYVVEQNSLTQEEFEKQFEDLPAAVNSSNFNEKLKDSKVVDDNGAPLRLYHGTSKDFQDFELVKGGRMIRGEGVYFTDDAARASKFARSDINEGANVRPVYLAAKNPLRLDEDSLLDFQDRTREQQGGVSGEKLTAQAKKEGYDAIVIKNSKDDKATDYIAFEPSQIVSAFANGVSSKRELDVADGLAEEMSFAEGDAIAAPTVVAEKKELPPILDDESFFNKQYRDWFNELEPIQSLTKLAHSRGKQVSTNQDVKLLSSTYAGLLGNVRQQLQVATVSKNDQGDFEVTGKSLKSILDDFDNLFLETEPSRDKRENDFSDYLIAARYLEDLKDREDVFVTEEQKAQSIGDMARLAGKYGDNFRFFETLAQEVYGFQRRILHNLVDSGVINEAKFKEITEKNKNYIPFDRVLEQETFAGVISSNGVFTDNSSNKVIKKLTGSDKKIKNVFQSIIKNTAKVLETAARNDVARSIANLSDVLPEYIQPTPIQMVKTGVAEIKVTFDPQLRTKLEKAIKAFGGDLEKLNKIKMKGYRNVLGSYSPMESLVRLKIGANEGVLAHEFGHMLDFKLGLKEKLLANKVIKEELKALAESRLGKNIELKEEDGSIKFAEKVKDYTPKSYLSYVKNDREVLANFYDAYVNSNEMAKELAPTAVAEFEKIIDSDKNLAFIKDIKPSTERGQEIIKQDAYGKAPSIPPNTLVVFEDGKEKHYKVSKPIMEAVNSLSPYQLNFIEKIFSFSSSLLRTGATLVPEFWVRNVLRDQSGALIQSGVKYNPADFARGLYAALGKNELYNQWERAGGSFNSFMELDDKGLERAYQELFRPKGKLMQYMKNPLRILEDASGTLEKATRIGVFSRAQKTGYSDIQSAYIARDATLDFSRKGALGKRGNRFIPFLNAGLQGLDKFVRTFRDNPKAATVWAVATVTFPSLMITGYYLYGAPDEERAEYLEIPQWQKDLFWCVKIGEEWKRYPKPFTFGYIFGTMPEKIMTAAFDGDKPEGQELWRELSTGMLGAFSPIYDASAVLPPIVKAAIETTTNYNFFTGRDIYPKYLEGLEPELQKTKYTSKTAELIGKEFGVSPALVENAIRDQFAGSTDYIMGGGDKILEQVQKWNGETIPEKPLTASDVVLLKAFAVRRPAGYRSASAGNFFENLNAVKTAYSSYRSKEFSAEKKREYYQEHREVITQYKPMQEQYKQMKALQKTVDAIYENKTMKAEEKVKRINDLEDKITLIARSANLRYSKATQKE